MQKFLIAFMPGDSHVAWATCHDCSSDVITLLDTPILASDAVLSNVKETCIKCGKNGRFMSFRDEMVLKWGWDTVNRIEHEFPDTF